MTKLIKSLTKPQSKHLVFTSAGDRSNLKMWLTGNKNFDLFVCYYGDIKNKFSECSDYYLEKKGGKFPNLHYIYTFYKKILDRYDSIFVIDDDIIFNTKDIQQCFEYLDRYNLWLLQPAFSPRGKISHRITQSKPFHDFRYTNFVEVTCPLFKKDKLFNFMEVYNPALVGWGVDHWFIQSLGVNIENRIAILDSVTCINPHDNTKDGQREIELLQNKQARVNTWNKIKRDYAITEIDKRAFNKKLKLFNLAPALENIRVQLHSRFILNKVS